MDEDHEKRPPFVVTEDVYHSKETGSTRSTLTVKQLNQCRVNKTDYS